MTEGLLEGVAAAAGIAVGPAYVVEEGTLPHPRPRPEGATLEVERERLRGALDHVDAELSALRAVLPPFSDESDANTSTDEPLAALVDAHRLLVRDAAFLAALDAAVEQRQFGAESAISFVIRDLATRLGSSSSAYLRERANDMELFGRRLIAALADAASEDSPPDGSVLVVQDLSPARAARLREEGVVGLVTTRGSATSHSALLARALGIPAVVGVRHAFDHIETGTPLVVDGFRGTVETEPREETLVDARARATRFTELLRELKRHGDQPCRMRDGTHVEVRANIELPEEAPVVASAGADGVGLFRTEYIYMTADEPPDEDTQAELYADALSALGRRPLTFRTFDLGADKLAPGVSNGRSAAVNPALGLRGLRLALERPDLFRTQLRALLRAVKEVPDGNPEILFPMVIDRSGLLRAKEVLQEEMSALGVASHQFRVGAMIEVPAAVWMVDVLLPHVDFVAIGTNDLLQYSFAVDRTDARAARLARATSPALFRAIEHVRERADAAEVALRVCGDAAADPLALPVLLGLGVREISVPLPSLPIAAAVVRESRRDELRPVAQAALRAGDAEELEEAVKKVLDPSLLRFWTAPS